jgi:ABC-2 type transport system ATP-binding protein
MTGIAVDHIVKRYRGHTALNDVTFQVPEAAIFGLLGPNGAGKTSLMRIINGITQPDAGHVTINGKLPSPTIARSIGYLPEERGLYRRMKVGEQIRYFARLKGLSRHDARRLAAQWMEKFGLTEWRNRRVEELSKGMAQKVQFIITVIHQPKLLIMDEPFSGFDPVNAALITTELKALQQNGTTVMLSTHNMASVEDLCSEIALINKGKLVLQGKVDHLKQERRSGLWEVEFKGNIIAFTNALWAGFELVRREQVANEHFKAYLKMIGNNDINAMLSVTMEYVKIVAVNEVLPTMDDIFIDAVKDRPADA